MIVRDDPSRPRWQVPCVIEMDSVPEMTLNPKRFDIVALRKLAGESVFTRGEAYHLKGQVSILSIDNWRVCAQVAGTEDYHTEVTGRDFEIAGSCSCPAFDDTSFCKHMVAVALAANAAGAELEDAGALARVRKYLRAQARLGSDDHERRRQDARGAFA